MTARTCVCCGAPARYGLTAAIAPIGVSHAAVDLHPVDLCSVQCASRALTQIARTVLVPAVDASLKAWMGARN